MKNKRPRAYRKSSITGADFANGLFTAAVFSSIVYLEALGLSFFLLNSTLAIYAFYRLFSDNQKSLLVAGFFIGILWFYWIPFSFRFYDISWLIPFAIIGFGLSYGLFFWLVGFATHPLARMPLVFLLSYFEPFNFNWFKPELLFVNTIFGVQKWQYAVILLSIALLVYLRKTNYRYLPALLLVAAFPYQKIEPNPIPFNMTLGETAINQHQKWQPQFRQQVVDLNMGIINKAIRDKKELVVLPESNFPLFINLFPTLEKKLKSLSQEITIVTGGLYTEGDDAYNATYHFEKGREFIAKKMILVPFGEYIPLPGFLREWMSDLFFDGAQEYKTAELPTDFTINKVKVRNANCYEGTCELFFEDHPKYMVVTSNNAWFKPSIQPVLQKMLMTLYAKRYHVTIFHSANNSKSEIINY